MTDPSTTPSRPSTSADELGLPDGERFPLDVKRRRIASGIAETDHREVSRDVRARKPNVVAALMSSHAIERAARVASLLALDLLGTIAALFTALAVKQLVQDTFVLDRVWSTTTEYAPFVFLVTALLFARSGLYSRREARPGVTAIASCLFQVAVVALIYGLVKDVSFNSYYIFYGGLVFGLIWISSLRALYEAATGAVMGVFGRTRRAILVGSGDQIDAVAKALSADHSPVRYDTVGFISLTPKPDNGLRDLGRLADLPALLDRHDVQEVIIADPDFPQREAFMLVNLCHDRNVAVRIAPTTMEILTHEAQLVPGQSVPLFEMKPPVFDGLDFVLKRGFDFVGASFLLLASSPVFLATAAAIKLTSRGPVFYRSRRPGIGGQPFGCIKFRTMHVDAEERQRELERMNEASGPLFKIRRDPRLTPIGGFLRRFSIDELPQLINVVKGEMSLVGPRPLPQRDYDMLDDWHRKRYLVLPGITGLWQVSGRSELDFDELVRLDFLYLERWSVFLDFSILLKTVPAVLARRGAF